MDQVEKLFEKAVRHFQAGQGERAEKALAKLLRQHRDHFDALNVMGVVLAQRGKAGEASRHFERALQLVPDHPDVASNLANLHEAAGRHAEAIRLLERVVARHPDHLAAFSNLGSAKLGAGDVDGAIAALQRALRINPAHPQAWNNLGSAWNERQAWSHAIDCFRQAIVFDPGYRDAHYNLANALFRTGRFAEGFAHYDYRESFTAPATGLPLLEDPRGESGRVLVLREQGLGDEIRYAGFLRFVDRGDWVVTCDPRLKALFARSFPGVAFASPDEGRGFTRWLREGRFARATQIATLGRWYWEARERCAGGYLRADPAAVEVWHERLAQAGGARRRVAIGWRGVVDNPQRRHWYMPLAILLQALGGRDLLLINIQHACTAEEESALAAAGEALYTPPIDLKDDQDALAALLSAVDVVISGTSSLAELAAALGLPVWVPSAISGEKWDMSPVYRAAVHPTMRLLAKGADEGWERVGEALGVLLDSAP